MEKIIVKLQAHDETSYPIYIAADVLDDAKLLDVCAVGKKRLVVITEHCLSESCGQPVLSYFASRGVQAELLTFAGKERNKNRKTKEKIENQLLSRGYGRDTCLVAVGGGVVSDVTGFVAATYCRGVDTVYLPTSLLAMVDAAVGGKTAVNTEYGKNMIGAFHQPKAVFVWLQTLAALPEVEYKNGLVEAIKYALIWDEQLLSFIEHNAVKIKKRDPVILQMLVKRVCEIKAEIVKNDEKDKGIRQICNFGHTVGHAVEQVSHYRIKHGFAVAMGIEKVNRIACGQGFLTAKEVERVSRIWRMFAIPHKIPEKYAWQDIESAMRSDKKTTGGVVQLVMPAGIGKTQKILFPHEISETNLLSILPKAN